MSSQSARLVVSLLIAIVGGVPEIAAPAHAADRQKHVLTLFATRRDAQFAVVAERRLPSLLAQGLPGAVDYYSEYIDSPRFTDTDYQRAFRDFLHTKFGGQRMDLVIAIGTVAHEFMAANRDALFPGTPVVFYVLEPQRVRIANSTGLLNRLHFDRSLELALALQPDLEHVYVVSGAGAADRRYEQQARREFQPLETQMAFTYFSGLAMQDLETRLRTLPSRSAVYVVLGTKDGTGENFQQMDYLSRVASWASAPTYSWADTTVDAGIVGGSRRDQAAETAAIASLALRVLHGARADDIAVASPDLDVRQVDWRQLRRWRIDERRLPPGTDVLFREPGVWAQYEGYIIAALTLLIAQTVLIAALLLQRAQRRRAEVQLRGSESRLAFSYERVRSLAGRLLKAQEEERARVARELHDDISQQLAILSTHLRSLKSVDRGHEVSQAAQRAQRISTSVHALSHQLHPKWLHLTGLVTAIDELRNDLSRPDRPIHFRHRDVPAEIDPDVALSAFRVAQEGLNNAMTHSDADEISIDLTGAHGHLELTILDNGVGFDVDATSHDGLGLISMRERVESVGGILEIHSAHRAGTRVTLRVPLHVDRTR